MPFSTSVKPSDERRRGAERALTSALFFVLQFDPALAFGLIATVNGELAAIAILSSGTLTEQVGSSIELVLVIATGRARRFHRDRRSRLGEELL